MKSFKVGDLVTIKGDRTNKVWKILGLPIKVPVTREQINHGIPKYPMYLIGTPVLEVDKQEKYADELNLLIVQTGEITTKT